MDRGKFSSHELPRFIKVTKKDGHAHRRLAIGQHWIKRTPVVD